MANVFKKSKTIDEKLLNPMGVGTMQPNNMANSNKKPISYTSNIRPEGQMQSSQRARDIFSPPTLYGQPVLYQSTKKGVRIQPQIRPKQTKTTQQTQQPLDNYRQFLQDTMANRQTAQTQARERSQMAQDLYMQQAPEILGTYEQQIAGMRQQQADIQRQMEQARKQGLETERSLQQQYAQAIGETETASEADLRRAAEARRVQQAQLEQKFANLGTLGSTGYFGQSGETQRAESEFLRGQQDIMSARTKAISDLNAQKSQAIMNAQNNVQTLLNSFQTQINEINSNVNIAYRDKVTMANQLYSNLEKTLNDLDSATRQEVAKYNKDIFDAQMEQQKAEADIAKERQKNIPIAPTIGELRNTEDALNLVETILQEGNLGAVTGRVRLTGIRPGGLRTETLLNTLLDKLTVEARKSLKGQGTITDREVEMLRNAILPQQGQAGLTERDLRAMLTVIGNRLNQDYISGTQLLNQTQMQQPTMGTSNFTIVEVQ